MLVIICIVTVIYLSPEMFDFDRYGDCEMRTDFACAMFVWTVLGTQAVISFSFMVGFWMNKGADRPV